MKKIIATTALFGAFFIFITSSKKSETHLAKPQTIKGIYVYVCSQPVDKYKVIEEVPMGLKLCVHNTQNYVSRIECLVDRVYLKYPNAKHIIVDEKALTAKVIDFE